jgi:predicted Rdx family selenoprotein
MVDWSDLTDRYDTLKGFSTAASYLNGNIFEYRFKPNTGGTHKIRIISKDRSGNEVWGKKREFGYPF